MREAQRPESHRSAARRALHSISAASVVHEITVDPQMAESALTVKGLEDDADGTRVVAEELRLLEVVKAALTAARAATVSADRGRALDEARLLELRDEAATAKPEDLPALFEQMHHIG